MLNRILNSQSLLIAALAIGLIGEVSATVLSRRDAQAKAEVQSAAAVAAQCCDFPPCPPVCSPEERAKFQQEIAAARQKAITFQTME